MKAVGHAKWHNDCCNRACRDILSIDNYALTLILRFVMDEADIKKIKTPIALSVYQDGKLLEEIETTFIGPAS